MTTYGESTDILTGGRWMADRHGIQRWTPDPPARKPTAHAIACPTCNATTVDWCRDTSGTARRPHPARRGERTCACGAPPTVGKARYCAACRAEARRETWRRGMQRRLAEPVDIYAQRRSDAADEFRQYAKAAKSEGAA